MLTRWSNQRQLTWRGAIVGPPLAASNFAKACNWSYKNVVQIGCMIDVGSSNSSSRNTRDAQHITRPVTKESSDSMLRVEDKLEDDSLDEPLTEAEVGRGQHIQS